MSNSSKVLIYLSFLLFLTFFLKRNSWACLFIYQGSKLAFFDPLFMNFHNTTYYCYCIAKRKYDHLSCGLNHRPMDNQSDALNTPPRSACLGMPVRQGGKNAFFDPLFRNFHNQTNTTYYCYCIAKRKYDERVCPSSNKNA